MFCIYKQQKKKFLCFRAFDETWIKPGEIVIWMCVTLFCLTHTNTPPGNTGLNNNRNMSEGVNGGSWSGTGMKLSRKMSKKRSRKKQRRALLCLCFQLNWPRFLSQKGHFSVNWNEQIVMFCYINIVWMFCLSVACRIVCSDFKNVFILVI